MSADDFVQVAALKSLIRLHHLSPDREPAIQSYMRATVKNLVRDEIRKLGRTPAHVALEANNDIGVESSALDRLVGRASWTTYQRAVKALTPKEQAAIRGRVQGGQSYEELRKTLRVATAGAARAATARALRRLITLICADRNPPIGCEATPRGGARLPRVKTEKGRFRRRRS